MAIAKMKDRLIAVRTVLGLSQRNFSKGIYLSQSYYAQIESETREINDRIIALISAKYSVSKDWLMKGKGEMFSDTLPDIQLNQLMDIFNELDPLFKEYILLQIKQLLEVQNRSKAE
jgi:transcriptional regulator with XRE-family HTH domain